MTTSSGNKVDLLNPDPSTILIEDIAHHLSQVNRYTGASRFPYSVAQHSYLMSTMVSPENSLAALLHDATEAYLGDVSSPLKQLLPDYRAIEDRFWRVISDKFGVPYILPEEVKLADLAIREAEKDALFYHSPDWGPVAEHSFTLPEVYPMSHSVAEIRFLSRWELLSANKNNNQKVVESEDNDKSRLPGVWGYKGVVASKWL
jgi:hypothetical protein